MSPFIKDWLLNALLSVLKIAWLSLIFVGFRHKKVLLFFNAYPELAFDFVFFLLGVAFATAFRVNFTTDGKDKGAKTD